jgi:hypothetical protein
VFVVYIVLLVTNSTYYYIILGPRDPPPLTLDLSRLDDPQSPYNIYNDSIVTDNVLNDLGQTYKRYLQANATVTYINELDGYENEPNMTTYLLKQSENLNSYR